jgi:predicted RNase H-like nuclease (RuvC/YqgF family)
MWADLVPVAGAIGLVVAGFFTARATVRAAKATARANEAAAQAAAAPAQQSANLAVLESTVKRVDEENGQLRGRMSRLEAVVRAFSWTTDRWARQMHKAGIEPEPAHPLVEEYNRTGV